MITLMIVLIAVLAAATAIAFVLLAGGVGVILAFGDLIVCGLIIGLLVRLFRQRKVSP